MIAQAPVARTRLVNKLFGVRLRDARRIRSFTQADLASKLGVSRVTVANLESGEQNVQLHQLFAVAEALDLRVEHFLPSRTEVEREASELGRVRSDRLEHSDLMFLSLVNDQLLGIKEFEDEVVGNVTGSDRAVRSITHR